MNSSLFIREWNRIFEITSLASKIHVDDFELDTILRKKKFFLAHLFLFSVRNVCGLREKEKKLSSLSNSDAKCGKWICKSLNVCNFSFEWKLKLLSSSYSDRFGNLHKKFITKKHSFCFRFYDELNQIKFKERKKNRKHNQPKNISFL